MPDAPRSSSALEGSEAAEAVDIAARDARMAVQKSTSISKVHMQKSTGSARGVDGQ